ncbi:MAG: IclR family transcriptional regulator [Pseudomonadota bacterium]
MAQDRRTAETGQVQSLVRALGALEELAHHPEGMTMTSLAKAIGLPRSTTHRLLTTMHSLQFVIFNDINSHWLVGPQAFTVGSAFGGVRDLARLGKPYLRAISMTTSELVSVSIPSSGSQLYVGQSDSKTPLPATYRPGARLPLHYGAAGKAMLAFWSENRLGDYISSIDFSKRTDKSTTDTSKLWEKIKRTRDRGYAFDCEECAKDLRCVGAPVFDEDGIPVAALSISAPLSRMNKDRMHSLGRELRATALKMTNGLGGRMPQALIG